MIKNIIKYIFIYTIGILFVGCNNNPMTPSQEFCDYCYLELEAPDLPMDKNGVYQLDYYDGEVQTFTQLRAYIGYEMEYVGWTTNTTFEGCTNADCTFSDPILLIILSGISILVHNCGAPQSE